MMKKSLLVGALALATIASVPAAMISAQAQGVERGAARGAHEGAEDAGPVGVVLPESGVTTYDVPEEHHVHGYRYAIVDDTPVLVDPHSRRIVEVID